MSSVGIAFGIGRYGRNGVFSVPTYNVEEVAEKAVEAPRWAHFGIGNIFRVFIAGIADDLIACGALDRGITCIETFDMEVVDRIYRPFDNLGLSVILKSDGSRDYRVLGSMAEAIKADCTDLAQWKRVMEVLSYPSLELISFTITEKGYALTKADGSWYEQVEKDLECGPECCTSAMAIVTAGLYKRYLEGCLPVALVSMDNCANNGRLLHDAVRTIAGIWVKKGFLEEGFLYYLEDTGRITFLCTMIDKITPRPSLAIAKDLEEMGLSGMEPVDTAKRTYIAPFVNAEKPQYLVIEDHFPNGRPSLEKGLLLFTGKPGTSGFLKKTVT